MATAVAFISALPVFKARVLLRSRHVGVRAAGEETGLGPEEKKPKKTSRAKKASSGESVESLEKPRRKKQESAGETPKKTSTRKKKVISRVKAEDTSVKVADEDAVQYEQKVVVEEYISTLSEEEEQAELRRKLYPKREKLWKKQYPWLGREFEETFVRPRNEPNPLICCFGESINEFIPSVRVCIKQMDEDAYSTWKGLQWIPPEFARSPGTNSANVAIAITRLAGKAAFVGKVGDDETGRQLVQTLQQNKVDTRGVRLDPVLPTALSRGRLVQHDKRKMSIEFSEQSAENSLDILEVDMNVIKEAKLFHFTSISLTTENMHATVMAAIESARKSGCVIFFDVNLPLPFWISREETWKTIEKAWTSADVIKINKVELEYLIEDEGLAMRVRCKDTIAKSWEEFQAKKNQRFEYHYTPEQIAPIWRDNIKILFVTDGTYRIHYYTPKFHGDVNGTEDVIASAHCCDRTGSGDTISAAMIRKLTAQPDIFENQDRLERALRFAVAAGVISQWTTGAVRGFPTESAAQSLTEQMFPLTQI